MMYIYVAADQSLGERISPCEVKVSKKTSKLADDSLNSDVTKMFLMLNEYKLLPRVVGRYSH